MSERVRVTFLYRLGQQVCFAGRTYEVVRRRYEEGTVSSFMQYGLLGTYSSGPCVWVYEPDLLPAEKGAT